MDDRGRSRIMLKATLRLTEYVFETEFRVVDVSRSGLKGRGIPHLQPGIVADVLLRNFGWISCQIAWVNQDVFGLKFAEEINPDNLKTTITGAYKPVIIEEAPKPSKLRRV